MEVVMCVFRMALGIGEYINHFPQNRAEVLFQLLDSQVAER